MSHTNSTTNYSLPQFVTSDKPAWLTDINNAFTAIDTGMNNAQTKANTADSNATQALSDASAAATAASTADAKGAGAVASIADTFQTTETYAVGDLVIYNNLLYICTAAVTDPGAWTGSTNWSRVTIEGVIDSLTGADIPVSSDPGADSISDAIATASGKAEIYSNSTYANKVGASIATTENMGDFRFLRITIGVGDFTSSNLAYILIPNCNGTTLAYYEFASNGATGKYVRIQTNLTTELKLLSSSEGSVGIAQVIGIY